MAIITAFAGETPVIEGAHLNAKARIYESVCRLTDWLEKNDYSGYDTFDGLSSTLLRPLTFNHPLLRIALQQGVRRFPINVRPVVGIPRSRSTKGMGFLARGFIRLHRATGQSAWADKARFTLEWLIENQAKGYTGSSWGNHFDYQSRVSYVPKGLPSVVWTSLIGHAFIDGFEHFGEERYLQIAVNACEHILSDLGTRAEGNSACISYFPGQDIQVHNANVLAGGFLARTFAHVGKESYRGLAEKSIQYTANHQRPDASWYYGEASNLHWVDNFHTAYVLDSIKHYAAGASDNRFETNLETGYKFWKDTFFLPDGTPRYYDRKTLPIDIQCCSQAIDTLVFFQDRDPQSISLALRVADWTIRHMQDRSGYFYYRRYSPWIVNKTATLHWGQATMLSALGGLYELL